MKPLRVKVAEALGWTDCEHKTSFASIEWLGSDVWIGHGPGECGRNPVPAYDTDWAATGPLIEKYGLTVGCANGKQGWWVGYRVPFDVVSHFDEPLAPTPLLAVCNLIVALGAAGKLGIISSER